MPGNEQPGDQRTDPRQRGHKGRTDDAGSRGETDKEETSTNWTKQTPRDKRGKPRTRTEQPRYRAKIPPQDKEGSREMMARASTTETTLSRTN